MGCCSSLNYVPLPQSTLPLPTQETIVRKHEKEFIFAKKPLSKVVESFKREGSQKQISIPQLNRALRELGLKLSAMVDPNNPVFRFFVSFMGEQLLDLTKIIVSAVLLSSNELDKKIKVLFDEYKDNDTRILKPADLKKMISDLFDVSVNHTPFLSLGEDEPEKLNSRDIFDYKQLLSQVEKSFVEDTYKILLGTYEDLGIKEFKSSFRNNSEALRILSSGGIRECILDKYKVGINFLST